MNYYIIVYKNTFDAMAADKKFTELKINFRVMPTPTSITQSCGICTRIEDLSEVKELIDNNELEFKNIYEKNENGFNKIK